MSRVWISGTGLYTPAESVSNRELVETFNRWVDDTNERHRSQIEAGERMALERSSVEFIEKASGIESRFVVEREGILDPDTMRPRLRKRSNDEPGLLCEMSLEAAQQALENAGAEPADVVCIIAACSNLERAYPAVAIEVQKYLGASGYAYDMNVACSSATFGVKAAFDGLQAAPNGGRYLIVNPEVCSGHLNFRDRDSHFIFGDAATAMVLERSEIPPVPGAWEVLGTRLTTVFSNNIRNNFGFLNRSEPGSHDDPDRLFVQEGRKVFKEVVPIVVELIESHLEEHGLDASALKRLWLHQANLNMNQLIARKVLGHPPSSTHVPTILDRYANTSSAGSIIAFHRHQDGLESGDHGLICSFGAGYSAGSVLVRKG